MSMNKVMCGIAMCMVMFTACEKEGSQEDQPEAIVKPVLSQPEDKIVISPSSLDKALISFQWEEAEDDVKYKLLFSKEYGTWEEISSVIGDNHIDVKLNTYEFEVNLEYNWKIEAVRLDENGQETSKKISSVNNSFAIELLPITNLSYQSSSYTYWPDNYEGSKAFVDLSWEDSPDMEYVEITFEPALVGVEQPIKVESGVQSIRIEGFEGIGSVAGSPEAQVYEFMVNTCGSNGFFTPVDTFKLQPLTHTFVNDVDFNTYIPVQMGEQVWLSSNLRTTHFKNGDDLNVKGYNNYGQYVVIRDLYYYGWADDNYSFDDLFYKSDADAYLAFVEKGVCPDGFHIPNLEDFQKLERFIGVPEDEIGSYYNDNGENQKVANALKSSEGWGLKADGTSASGSDPYHFNLIPNQYLSIPGQYTSSGVDEYCLGACLLTGRIGASGSYGRHLYIIRAESDGIANGVTYDGEASIRCIKDSE